MKKILAVSSSGGHWTQLQRIKSSFDNHEIVYVSTILGYRDEVEGFKFYKVTNASKWSKIELIKLFFELVKIFIREKPDYVISTGAAPGALSIFIGRFFRAKTIWLDSIANFEKISLSGRLIKNITHLHLTQWKHLQTKKIKFKGKVL